MIFKKYKIKIYVKNKNSKKCFLSIQIRKKYHKYS